MMTKLAVAALAAALALAACSGNKAGDPPPLNEGNAAATELAPEANVTETVTMTPDNMSKGELGPADGDRGEPSEQVFEDADASGMTARLPPPPEEPVPATQGSEEQK